MAEIHHLTHGVVSPVVAYLISFLGSLLGLVCTTRAREARTRRRRARWLVLAAVSIGGAAIWLMHFTAMLGFDVPVSPVRYDPFLTAASLVIAVATVGAGLFIAGHGRRSTARIAGGGLLTGCGVLAMHYTGMAAVRVAGRIEYDPGMVAASGIIAVVAATVALWFTVTIRGWRAIVIASGIMGVAVCGMHYTGMAAMRVRLWPLGEGRVEGINPSLLVVPITLLTSTALVAAALSALQAMTEEEFTDPVTPRVGRHATVALDLGRIRAHRDRLTPIRPSAAERTGAAAPGPRSAATREGVAFSAARASGPVGQPSWGDELNTGERWV